MLMELLVVRLLLLFMEILLVLLVDACAGKALGTAATGNASRNDAGTGAYPNVGASTSCLNNSFKLVLLGLVLLILELVVLGTEEAGNPG